MSEENKITPEKLREYLGIFNLPEDDLYLPRNEFLKILNRTNQGLLRINHPDRQGADASPELIRKANETTAKINEAYKALHDFTPPSISDLDLLSSKSSPSAPKYRNLSGERKNDPMFFYSALVEKFGGSEFQQFLPIFKKEGINPVTTIIEDEARAKIENNNTLLAKADLNSNIIFRNQVGPGAKIHAKGAIFIHADVDSTGDQKTKIKSDTFTVISGSVNNAEITAASSLYLFGDKIHYSNLEATNTIHFANPGSEIKHADIGDFVEDRNTRVPKNIICDGEMHPSIWRAHNITINGPIIDEKGAPGAVKALATNDLNVTGDIRARHVELAGHNVTITSSSISSGTKIRIYESDGKEGQLNISKGALQSLIESNGLLDKNSVAFDKAEYKGKALKKYFEHLQKKGDIPEMIKITHDLLEKAGVKKQKSILPSF